MGLGVWFSEDIAHVLRGAGEGVSLVIAQRGLRDATDAAYVAGYWAALRTVATSLGLPLPATIIGPLPSTLPEWAERSHSFWEENQ